MALLFTSSCVPTENALDQDSVIQIMNANGCWWNQSKEEVTLQFENPYWVMRSKACLEECRVHTLTREFAGDKSSMCTGVLVE